jgi:hypothetical protein
MSNNTDGDLFQLCVRKIKDSVIPDTNTIAVAVLQFFAAMREGIFFQCEDRFGDACLNLCRELL